MPDVVPIRRALISVSDKTGLIELGRALAARGAQILSTGGTRKALADAGLTVTEVATHTGFPEILDGRVKTLHPRIHGGILARSDHAEDQAALAAHDIPPIDLVVVNLYPFERTIAGGATFEACVEQIDIGGPALIRAAAKNHESCAVVTDVCDYAELLAEMRTQVGATTRAFRRRLALAAFQLTAAYDATISNWFARQLDDPLPRRFAIAGRRAQEMRYGENPHQRAAFYVTGERRPGVATARQIQGKELSYNNLNDTDAAYELVAEFDRPAVAIVKHANPCGVAVADSLPEAWRLALRCDPVSAYGGIVAVNRPLDDTAAAEMAKLFLEVVIAPDIEARARDTLAGKKNLRVLEAGGLPDPVAPGMTIKWLAGGFLLQDRDAGRIREPDLEVVSKRKPTAAEIADCLFAFRICKHVKSNAMVYAKDGATVGIGAGQMSRVDSARIAAHKAQEAAKAARLPESLAKGSAVASDAFFPFADGLIAAAEAGATAIIQPGGSVRDEEVIAAADERGLAMVFTGMRHFRH